MATRKRARARARAQASKQASKQAHACAQCSHASVGLAQARPNNQIQYSLEITPPSIISPPPLLFVAEVYLSPIYGPLTIHEKLNTQ